MGKHLQISEEEYRATLARLTGAAEVLARRAGAAAVQLRDGRERFMLLSAVETVQELLSVVTEAQAEAAEPLPRPGCDCLACTEAAKAGGGGA
jgi:hypothetical protein